MYSGNQFSSKYVIQTWLPFKLVIPIIIDIDFPNISSMNIFHESRWHCFLDIEYLTVPLSTVINRNADYWQDVLIYYSLLGENKPWHKKPTDSG